MRYWVSVILFEAFWSILVKDVPPALGKFGWKHQRTQIAVPENDIFQRAMIFRVLCVEFHLCRQRLILYPWLAGWELMCLLSFGPSRLPDPKQIGLWAGQEAHPHPCLLDFKASWLNTPFLSSISVTPVREPKSCSLPLPCSIEQHQVCVFVV